MNLPWVEAVWIAGAITGITKILLLGPPEQRAYLIAEDQEEMWFSG